MKQLGLSSAFVFHIDPVDDIDAFIRRGLELHRELGFAAVNLSYTQVDAMGENFREQMETAVQAARLAGVRYGVAHLPFVAQKVGVPQGDAFNARMLRCIEAFGIAGVDYAVVHPNSTTRPLEGYDPTAEYDNVMAHLSPFVEYANKLGVNIVIENMRVVHGSVPAHRYCADPEELCKVADTLGIGVCWDTGHANIVGLQQSEAIAYVGSRLKMLHLNDNFAEDDIHIAPFCGNIDWADTMQALTKIGYEGYLNFEVSPGRMNDALRASFGRHLAAVGQELMKLM